MACGFHPTSNVLSVANPPARATCREAIRLKDTRTDFTSNRLPLDIVDPPVIGKTQRKTWDQFRLLNPQRRHLGMRKYCLGAGHAVAGFFVSLSAEYMRRRAAV